MIGLEPIFCGFKSHRGYFQYEVWCNDSTRNGVLIKAQAAIILLFIKPWYRFESYDFTFGKVLKRLKRSASKADRGFGLRGFKSHSFRKIKKIRRKSVMEFSKEIRVMHLQNRLNKLKAKPVENANLMRKVERQLRKLSV